LLCAMYLNNNHGRRKNRGGKGTENGRKFTWEIRKAKFWGEVLVMLSKKCLPSRGGKIE